MSKEITVKAELLNEIIKYLMTRSYSEVYELMDKIRALVIEANKVEEKEQSSNDETEVS